MACTDADEIRARLAFRALWTPKGAASAAGANEEDDHAATPVPVPAWRRDMLAEFNEALEGGFARRLKRLESKIELLVSDTSFKHTGQRNGSRAEPAQGGGGACTRSLSEALARAQRATRPRAKAYGPSGKQEELEDPPNEKREEPILETTTTKMTLEALEQNLTSRRRQILALRQQLSACEELRRAVELQTEAASAGEQALLADPAALRETHDDSLARRRARVAELRGKARTAAEQARRYQKLFHHQRRYILQTERIAMIGGPAALARHPAGDVVLVSLPGEIGGERPEVWDIGTAIANPYCVDSWPFEPNVLARRTFQQEGSMDPFPEETEEDLEQERRRLPFLASLRAPAAGGRGGEDEEDDYEDYNGPSATSRSL